MWFSCVVRSVQKSGVSTTRFFSLPWWASSKTCSIREKRTYWSVTYYPRTSKIRWMSMILLRLRPSAPGRTRPVLLGRKVTTDEMS